MLPIVAFVTLQTKPTEFAEAWDKATRIISQSFYAKATRSEEMKKTFAKWEPKAKAATSRVEFGQVMNAMISEFHDSHFGFLGNDEQGYYLFDGLSKSFSTTKKGEEMPHIGAWFHTAKGGYSIQMLLEGGPAATAGLRKGDVIATIDGEPFSPVQSLASRVNKDAKLEVIRHGKRMTVTVQPKSEPGLDVFLNATRTSAHLIESGKKKYGYIHLWTQGTENFITALHNAVSRFQETDGFILDLRDGFGGRPEKYADPFFRPDVKLEWGMQGNNMVQHYGYGKPLMVLINEGSRSAKEVLSYILKKSKRATLIGHNTAGAVLGTTPLRLNEWSFLEVPMVTVKADGDVLEGKGVAPHIVVPEEYDEQGNDLVIKKAVEVLDHK